MRALEASLLTVSVLALLTGAEAVMSADYPVGGTQPSHRPDGAPVITVYVKDAAWYQRALTGIDPPYPYSLRFLEDQGPWYTPFDQPGMTGRYDIRGWYASP